MYTSATLGILTALLFLPAVAPCDDAHNQGQTVLPSTAQCGEKYSTTYQITKCVSEVQDQLNPILNRVVEATRQHMQTRIAGEKEPRYVDELRQAAASFEKAQAAWEQYREFQCDAREKEFLGGTGREAGYLGCLADITSARILELWSATGLPAPK
jgi:uncharacterized protein YecT (DUF1311 family)